MVKEHELVLSLVYEGTVYFELEVVSYVGNITHPASYQNLLHGSSPSPDQDRACHCGNVWRGWEGDKNSGAGSAGEGS